LIVGIGAVLVVAGCTAGADTSRTSSIDSTGEPLSSPPTRSTAVVGTIPDDVHIVMAPGSYQTVAFNPAFTFSSPVTLGGGADFPDVANFSLKIYGNSYYAGMMFVRFDRVCDPNAPYRLTAAPSRLVECLLRNPHLHVTAKPQPVSIAGVSGRRLDVEVVGKLPGPSSCNGDPHPCMRLGTTPAFPPASDGGLGEPVEDGYSARIWVLDVHDTQVAVFWSDLTEHFASNVSTAQKILRTVRFS
jgi:hypothetical protein